MARSAGVGPAGAAPAAGGVCASDAQPSQLAQQRLPLQ